MSQENVEVVRRFIDHYNETGDPLRELIDPDVTWVVDPDAFIAGTYRGPDGFTDMLGRLEEVFGDIRVEVDDLIDAGDVVVMLGRFRVRGAQSGAAGTQQIGLVLRLREGRLVHYRSYLRREEALEAVGPRD